MLSDGHGAARRLRVAAALLATVKHSIAVCLADASPMSSKMGTTINMVECICGCFTVSLIPATYSPGEFKVPCKENM
jgi:hypothetical protein